MEGRGWNGGMGKGRRRNKDKYGVKESGGGGVEGLS